MRNIEYVYRQRKEEEREKLNMLTGYNSWSTVFTEVGGVGIKSWE